MKYIKEIIFVGLIILFGVIVFLFKPIKKTIYFCPGHFNFIEGSDVNIYGHNLSKMCRERGLNLKVMRSLDNLKDVNKIIIFEIKGYKPKILKKYPKKRVILFLWEPPSVLHRNYKKKYHRYFSKIFTWDDSLVDNKKYFKFYYPELRSVNMNKKNFSEKKLITTISKNRTSKHPFELYSKRLSAIKFFEKNIKEDFDLYGQGWDKENFEVYKGEIKSKKILQDYKFAICYENIQNIEGYITEKIFDCFKYLCVPVYLGANNISSYIPKNCFIDRRDFENDEELLVFLQNMKEEEYQKYLNNIKTFVDSSESKCFSPENFGKIFENILKDS